MGGSRHGHNHRRDNRHGAPGLTAILHTKWIKESPPSDGRRGTGLRGQAPDYTPAEDASKEFPRRPPRFTMNGRPPGKDRREQGPAEKIFGIARSIPGGPTLEEEEDEPMNDDGAPRRQSLERFRSYLLLLARMQLGAWRRGKIDPSDVVQQMLLEAHAKWDQFQGDDSARAAWLRRVLVNNLHDAWRALRRGKRDVAQERSPEEVVDQSSARLEGLLADRQSSPSQQAVRGEDLLRLANALARLPDAQREAVVLHHLQGCSLSETARRPERSDAAVAGLLHRGLKKLRELMTPGE